jgi:hypothetical protein
MLSFVQITVLNASTYVDQRNGKQKSLAARYLAMGLIAIAGATIFPMRSDNVYLGLITAQSILVGFSFNVMIFLVSNHTIEPRRPDVREERIKAERLNGLSKDIFYNLSYFNLIGMLSVALSLGILLVGSMTQTECLSEKLLYLCSKIASLAWLRVGVLALLYFVTLESLLSFARLVRRVTYYFSERVGIEQN